MEWFMEHDNIVLLAHFLADNGASAKEVASAIEKPWNYESSFNEAKAEAEKD
jgi:hypothetical protein